MSARTVAALAITLAIGLPVIAPAADEADSAQPAASARIAAAQTPRARAPAKALSLETTEVTGNRELPRVMVIVPWKNAEPADATGRPLASLVESVLTPVDRDVFRRELGYYALLHGNAQQDGEQSPHSASNPVD